MEELLARMAEVYGRFEGRRNICGAAVSCPGAVDGKNGVIHGSSAVPYIHEIPFRDMVSGALGGLSVLIENDARCFAMGEMWLGEAAGAGHFSTIAIGSGVGGAMVHEREDLARRIEEKVNDILCPGQNFSFLKPKLVRSRNNNRSNRRGALFALLQRVEEEKNEGISV